jgi:iron complex outermembrane receptor protein
LNPVELLDSYKDFTNTNKFFGSINTTWKITSKLKYQFLVGVESSTSSRKKPVVAYYGYSECCASRVPGSTDVKRGQASINIKIDLIKLLSIL